MILFQENTLPVIASVLFLAVSSFYVIIVPPFQKDKKLFVIFSVFFALWLVSYSLSSNTMDKTMANFIHRYIQLPTMAFAIFSLVGLIYYFPQKLSHRRIKVLTVTTLIFTCLFVFSSFLPPQWVTYSARKFTTSDIFTIYYPDKTGRIIFLIYVVWVFSVFIYIGLKKVQLFTGAERKASLLILAGVFFSMGFTLFSAVLLPVFGLAKWSILSPLAAPVLILFFAYSIFNYNLMGLKFSQKLTLTGFFILILVFLMFTFGFGLFMRGQKITQMESIAAGIGSQTHCPQNYFAGIKKITESPGRPEFSDVKLVMEGEQIFYLSEVPNANGNKCRIYFDHSMVRSAIHQFVIHSFFQIIAASGLYFLLSPFSWRVGFINPIRHLIKLSDNIVREESEKGDAVESDEIAKFSRSLNAAIEKMKYVHEEREVQKRLKSELLLARKIQLQSFPENRSFSNLEIYAINIPAAIVSGDFYDVFQHDQYIYFYLGDVSGKSYSAGLYTTMLQSTFRITCAGETNPASILSLMNNTLVENSYSGMFFTVFLGIYNLSTREVNYCSGGHLPQVLLRSNGSQDILQTKGLPPGISKNKIYETRKTILQSGDTILLFSDGASEAENPQGEQLGEEEIFYFMGQDSSPTPEETVNHFQAKIIDFTKNINFEDDLTILALRCGE